MDMIENVYSGRDVGYNLFLNSNKFLVFSWLLINYLVLVDVY
jgi:hypothetical protein